MGYYTVFYSFRISQIISMNGRTKFTILKECG